MLTIVVLLLSIYLAEHFKLNRAVHIKENSSHPTEQFTLTEQLTLTEQFYVLGSEFNFNFISQKRINFNFMSIFKNNNHVPFH